jgi:phage terminase large subunit-like protein
VESLPGSSRADRERLLELLAERETRAKQRKFYSFFPDEDVTDPLTGEVTHHARSGYARHLEHFAAGADYTQRLFMAANRVGKTIAGSYELTCHLTGEYPHWWQGRRFPKPISAWAAGKTDETTRDVPQMELLGAVIGRGPTKRLEGTGMVPGRLLATPTWKSGIPDFVDTIRVKHVTGGWSLLGFKSFKQGRGSFEGTAKHVIWGDEEMPIDVFGECLLRTMTTNGLIILTFTPLEGLTPLVKTFLQPEEIGDATGD